MRRLYHHRYVLFVFSDSLETDSPRNLRVIHEPFLTIATEDRRYSSSCSPTSYRQPLPRSVPIFTPQRSPSSLTPPIFPPVPLQPIVLPVVTPVVVPVAAPVVTPIFPPILPPIQVSTPPVLPPIEISLPPIDSLVVDSLPLDSLPSDSLASQLSLPFNLQIQQVPAFPQPSSMSTTTFPSSTYKPSCPSCPGGETLQLASTKDFPKSQPMRESLPLPRTNQNQGIVDRVNLILTLNHNQNNHRNFELHENLRTSSP